MLSSFITSRQLPAITRIMRAWLVLCGFATALCTSVPNATPHPRDTFLELKSDATESSMEQLHNRESDAGLNLGNGLKIEIPRASSYDSTEDWDWIINSVYDHKKLVPRVVSNSESTSGSEESVWSYDSQVDGFDTREHKEDSPRSRHVNPFSHHGSHVGDHSVSVSETAIEPRLVLDRTMPGFIYTVLRGVHADPDYDVLVVKPHPSVQAGVHGSLREYAANNLRFRDDTTKPQLENALMYLGSLDHAGVFREGSIPWAGFFRSAVIEGCSGGFIDFIDYIPTVAETVEMYIDLFVTLKLMHFCEVVFGNLDLASHSNVYLCSGEAKLGFGSFESIVGKSSKDRRRAIAHDVSELSISFLRVLTKGTAHRGAVADLRTQCFEKSSMAVKTGKLFRKLVNAPATQLECVRKHVTQMLNTVSSENPDFLNSLGELIIRGIGAPKDTTAQEFLLELKLLSPTRS